jgi:hypothetical protein
MSNDIVERLLICAKYDPYQKEAADEITRLRAELAAANAREQEAAKALQEHVFRAFQEGFNSSLSYMGAYDMADAWEMSDAKARIDTFLKGGGGE